MLKYYVRDNIVNILIYNNDNIVGIIKVFKRTKEQGILDIFIRPRYRCKWVNKNIYFYSKNRFIEICRDMGYNLIITRVNNIKSLRLLKHFGYIKYNNLFYYLVI